MQANHKSFPLLFRAFMAFLTLCLYQSVLHAQTTIIVDHAGSGNYTSIQDAFNALNGTSISQKVTIRIKPGIYDEHLFLDSISGASRQQPIIIESFTGDTADVIINYDSASIFPAKAVLDVRKVNFLIIRNLSFNAPDQNGYIIGLLEGARNLIIEDNHFRYDNAGHDYPAISTHFDFMANDLTLDSIWIRNNLATDMLLYSGIFSSFTPKFVEFSNNTILFNRYMTGLAFYSGNTIICKENIFHNQAIGSFSNNRAIWVEGNTCYSPGGSMVITANSSSDSAAVVINNFLAHESSVGIQVGGGHVQIYHNSILGTDSTNQSFGIYINEGDSTQILNNIIGGLGNQAYGLFLLDSAYPSSFICDYNCYYVPDGNVSYTYASTLTINETLADHVATMKFDSNSLEANPLFVSETDLHIRNAILSGNGINIPWITKDIDGDNRDSGKPCIGADAISGSIDLVPKAFTAITGNFYPGKTVQIEYEVENLGALDLSTITWYDDIYLSSNQTLDQNDIKLTELQNSLTVNAGNSYLRKPSVSIPYISSGTYYLILRVNKTMVNFEELSNNILISQAITLPVIQLPNLQVTAVSVPSSVYSGKSFTVSWTVKNVGNAATNGAWTDYVYASHDQNFLQTAGSRNVDSILKLKISAPNGLNPGESYTSSSTFSTAIKFSGNLYYRVQTNAQLDIFEQDTTFSDNGKVSAALNVIQSPLPDLKITDANIQSTAFSGDTISVNWTVSNVGEQKTYRTDRFYRATPLQENPKMWYDRLVITRDPFYHPHSKNNITKAFYARPANDELDPDSSYTVVMDISLDACEYGTYYVFAVTNYDRSTFELSYTNNVFFVDSIVVVLKPNPDLTPTDLTVNNSPASGKIINISYTVKNDGFRDKDETYHRDRLYLHVNSTFSSGGLTYLGQVYIPDTVEKGASYTNSGSFDVPYSIYGQYYLSVVTDPEDRICEAPYEENNIKTIGPINIALSLNPDLVVSAEQPDDTLFAGANLDLKVTTSNEGQAVVAENYFFNQIYLIGEGKTYRLLKTRQEIGLQAGASREDIAGISLPLDVEEGTYRIMVHTDFSGRVFEYDKEDNNYWYSEEFHLGYAFDRVCDLEVSSMEIRESNLRAGDLINIDLEITNNSRATYLTGWKDHVYLETVDGIYGLQEFNHTGRIEQGASVSTTITYRLPYDISGSVNIVFVSNALNKPLEYIRNNNSGFLTGTVLPYTPPDLEATAIVVGKCCQLYALQLDTISVEVKNNGPGIVAGQDYFAKVYLSDDPFLDQYDHLLGTHQQFSGLNVNSGEEWELPVKYPSHLSGDFYVIVDVDTEDDIYESAGEDNNRFASGYTISLTNEITDLSVDSVYLTSYSGSSDALFYVNFDFSKPQNDSVERDWTNRVILSQSRNYVQDGINSTAEVFNANLPAGQTDFNHNVLAIIEKNIQPGWYYIGVFMDSYNEVYENSESNNIQFTADSFFFDFSVPLELNVSKDTHFYEGFFAADVYYHVDRPEDFGMILDLDVSDNDASTEMYQAAGRVPTSLDFDNRYNNPYLADQQIVVPVTDTNVKDYIHVIPSYVPPVYHGWDPKNNQIDPVPYTITATAASFSILSVFPENGSVYGHTTVEVTGFDFDSSTQFYLVKNQDTIYPSSTGYINSSHAVIYLDLRDRELGNWSVMAEKPTKITALSNGFEIMDNGFEHPWVNINIVPAELTRRSTVLNLNFGNYANTDGYDYWLVLAMSTTSGDISNLSSYYVGSSEEELNELYGFDGNPTGDSTFVDEDSIRFFVYWIPKLSAKSQTTFTYIINQSEIDTTVFYALLFRQPMSDYTLSGNMDDLAASATMYELYDAFSNNAGLLNKTSFDCDNINIAGVQRELATQTVLLADHVHGGVGTFSGARSMKDMSNKAYEAWKKDALLPFEADQRSEEIKQKIFKETVLEKKGILDMAKGYIDNINPFTNVTGRFYKEDPPFSDLVKNVFSCLDNNPDFQQDRAGACLTCSWNTQRTHQTCHWTCDKKNDNEDNAVTRWVKSFDPNEIIGPEGTTDLRYVQQSSEMEYIIRFENKAEASAPAVVVSIENPLDTAFRLQSFKLTELGFGDTILFLNGANHINKVIELGPKYNFQKLRIVAGIDPVNHRAFWRLTAIDPVTGNPVQDPYGGFLPPNDSTGMGEGYVKYTIDLRPNLNSGLEVSNRADIIFDQNEIIGTNTWTNIVVDTDPNSKVDELPQFSASEFEVHWSGTDGALGPGIASYSVFVSVNDSTYIEWIRNSTDTTATFEGKEGYTYKFFSIMHLTDGNSELAPASYDASTTIKTEGIEIVHGDELIVIYPNPGTSELNFRQESNGPLEVRIFSLTGELIGTYLLSGKDAKISTTDLAKGMYIIQLNASGEISYARWIRQ